MPKPDEMAQPDDTLLESQPKLKIEAASLIQRRPSATALVNGAEFRNDAKVPELQEPVQKASERGNDRNNEEKRSEEEDEVSDGESGISLGREEKYQFKSPSERKKKAGLRLHLKSMEERMAALESQLNDLKKGKDFETIHGSTGDNGKNDSDAGNYSSELEYKGDDIFMLPKVPYRKIDEQDWKKFQGGNLNDCSVVEILKGQVGIGKNKWITTGSVRPNMKSVVPGMSTEASTTAPVLDTLVRLPHRVKIHSRGILKTLEKVSGYKSSNLTNCTLVAPFKTLARFEAHIRDELKLLEATCPENLSMTGSGGYRVEPMTPHDTQQHGSGGLNGDQAADEHQKQTEMGIMRTKEIRKTLLTVAELRVLVTLMNTKLKGISNVQQQIRNGTLKTITFSNLFLLFNPGDTVFREEPTNQAYQVFSTCGGLPIDRSKAWENRLACHHNDLYSYNEHDVASPFVIDCYSFAFDGKTYGPVQKTFVLQYFAGEKRISSLPICPEKLHPRGRAFRDTLIKNGTLFVELVQDGQSFAHRTYEGWGRTYKGEPEEIDSQVIIDFSATFRRFMDWAPKLGLEGATPQDPREMTDCSGVPHYKDEEGICIMCENDAFWPEDQIERLRSTEYLDSVRDDLQTTQRASDLKANKLILLPATIFGFALRSRKWMALNVENIQDLLPPEEAFDDLVIMPEHKRLVQALVKTHDRSAHSSGRSFVKLNEDYHADLVRGKGRGLIILLHGPPGVGKTSTAECVADLTGRPLFQITCGDIGTEPDTVEKSLDENFQLAHRWECVLLLDEADVFLQERDRTNLKRNALVSVFLRTLEYYSGILFLTTNREGTLDEAFKSRIHISLHYERPNGKDWLKIWKNNIRRVSRHYIVDEKEILSWAKSRFVELNWNGRQIRNAFQAATALAKFSAQETDISPTERPQLSQKVRLNIQNFNDVANASIGFDDYLQSIYGLDKMEDRLLREKVRNDNFHGAPQPPRPSNTSPMSRRQSSSNQGTSAMQQQHPFSQQSPRGYNQNYPSTQDRRGSASQRMPQHMQGMGGMQGLGGMHGNGGDSSSYDSMAMTDDFWGDEDDEMASPAMH